MWFRGGLIDCLELHTVEMLWIEWSEERMKRNEVAWVVLAGADTDRSHSRVFGRRAEPQFLRMVAPVCLERF